MGGCEVTFPNLGITLKNVPTGFEVFGFEITYYALLITFGMIMGYLAAGWVAVKTGQDKEVYLDFALVAIILSVIGARLYYVIFSWDEYKNNLWEIFNIRGGGLAIYGGVITAIIVAIVFCRMKKLSFWLLVDTGCIGLITGQIIGRWGNFFNKEAFGGYTDNLFAMGLPWNEAVRHMPLDSAKELSGYVQNGMIQVHPTFLYESVWNLILLVGLLLYTKHKKFDGEIFWLYLAGYGLGRVWIEGMRTDQLFLWGTDLPVSQVLALVLFLFGVAAIIVQRIRLKRRSL